jgi:integrase
MFASYKVLNKETSNQMLKRWNKTTKIRAVLNKLNQYFDYKNIDFNTRLPRNPRNVRHIPDVLTREELKEVLDKMPEEARLIISCIFNIGAGLRISEVINLCWNDISWQDWSLENKTINVIIRNSKRNKDRIVPIPHFTTAELFEYAKKIGKLDEKGYPAGGKIFDFDSAKFKKELKMIDKKLWEYEYTKHSYDFVRHNLINRYFKAVQNRHITAHSLRHARASELYNVYKVPIAKIQQWLGHSDIATTMIYVHLSTDEDRKIMENVGGV